VDRFSQEILERTIELAIEAMPPDKNPRAALCVKTILAYIESPDAHDEQTVRTAVIELMQIARQNGLFFIAARLAPIAHQLTGLYGKSGSRANM